jgi:hypothetical protein
MPNKARRKPLALYLGELQVAVEQRALCAELFQTGRVLAS